MEPNPQNAKRKIFWLNLLIDILAHYMNLHVKAVSNASTFLAAENTTALLSFSYDVQQKVKYWLHYVLDSLQKTRWEESFALGLAPVYIFLIH